MRKSRTDSVLSSETRMPGTSGFKGWTLPEAIERTANPDEYAAMLAARKDFNSLGAQPRISWSSPFVHGPAAWAHNRQQKFIALTFQEKQAAVEQYERCIEASFFEHMSRERLVGVGTRAIPTANPMILRSAAWKDLRLDPLKKSTLIEATREQTPIYDVRIFPIVHAPNAAELLTGLSLADAFRRCVLDDPEVQATGQHVVRHAPELADVYGQGRFPGASNDYKWPLDVASVALALHLVEPSLGVDDATQPVSTNAARVLVDRLRAFRDILVSGLVVDGRNEITGEIATIDPLQRESERWALDIQNNELFDMTTTPPTRWWSALALASAGPDMLGGERVPRPISPLREADGPAASFPVKPTRHDTLRSASLERPRSPSRRQKASPSRTTTQATRHACRRFLMEVIAASPTKRTHTKKQLFGMAKAKWPDLPSEAFNDARRWAIEAVPGADAWRHSGAPAKSPRS
jgi:hypothetical protein